MSETSHPNYLLSSQLRSLRSEQITHAHQIGMVVGELRSLRELVHHLLQRLTHPGPPPSSASPPPSPTPGTPASSPKADLGKLAKDLGERVHLASQIFGLIKGLIIIGPWVVAAWKWVLPYLWRLVPGF
jgi:hypothetical protein